MDDLDLGGTAIKNCGESSGDDGDVVTMKYAMNCLNRWLPAHLLGWFRENARACFYFKARSDFIFYKRRKIIGFKSQSKYYPVNAVSEKDPVTIVQLPSKALCARFEGKSLLSVKDVHLSPPQLFTTLVVTFKATKEIVSSEENIVTDCNRALTISGGDVSIYGIRGGGSFGVTPTRKLNEWNTICVQWGSDEDSAGHVYINEDKHITFTSSCGREHINNFHIGGLVNSSFMNGDLSNLEVYLTESPIPEVIRKLIMEDHQNTVKMG